jgi:hypothetical protein
MKPRYGPGDREIFGWVDETNVANRFGSHCDFDGRVHVRTGERGSEVEIACLLLYSFCLQMVP